MVELGKMEIICKNNGNRCLAPIGASISELQEICGYKGKYPIVAAYVNNQIHSLTHKIFRNKTIEFIDQTNLDGQRIHINTLICALNKAINDVVPNGRLRVEHTISGGYFCKITTNDETVSNDTLCKIKERLTQLIKENHEIIHHNVPTKEAEELFKSKGYNDTARLLHFKKEFYTFYCELDGQIDFYPTHLLPSTGYLKSFELTPYFDGFLLRSADVDNNLPEAKDQSKSYEVFRENWSWTHLLGLWNVCDLNIAKRDDIDKLIKVTEALHEKKIVKIADQIAADPRIKVILIAGPSSSGKTTFSKRLSVQLAASGIIPVTLSMDNYFVNRDKTPIDENGDTDFESIYAVDIECFCDQLQRLINGELVETPVYNFTTGMREETGIKMQVKEGQVIVIEGIHGLNPELTKTIADEAKFKIYVSALTTISLNDHNRIPTTDNRLLRRIIRDYKYRSYSAENTILRWPSVRRGEDKWIFPYQENADAMFNSSLPFEFAAIKKQAEPLLTEVPESSDAYPTAVRLLNMLKYITPISYNDIPPVSLLREFLGGSGFKY